MALQALHEVATDVLGHLDVEAALLTVVNAATDLVAADIAGIMLAEEDGTVLRMRASTGHRTVDTAHLEVRRGQGVAGKVFETRQPCKIDNYLSDSSISRDFFPIAKEEGKRSALGAPMIARGEVVGVLMAWRRRPSVFTAEDTQTLVSLANLATIAIVNARLYAAEHNVVARLEETNDRLERQNRLLQRSSRVHEELDGLVIDGAGIADLVETLVTHTGGRAGVLDADLQVLAMSPGSDTSVARAVRHLRASERTPRTAVLPPDQLDEHWLLVREVVAGDDRLGHLVVGLDRHPDGLDSVIVEQAAIVCALQQTRERAVLDAHIRVHDDFVWDLLEGNIRDTAEALVRARYLGYCLPRRLRVVLLAIEGVTAWSGPDGDGAAAATRRREALVRGAERLANGGRGESAFAAMRGSLLAMIVPATEDTAEARALGQASLQGLSDQHPELRLSAGVSACFGLAADLSQAYAQAQSALSAAPLVASGPPLALFDELGVVRFLVAPGDRRDLWGFARKVLGPVIDYDRERETDLVRTIEAYLANDCNLQRTAACLYVHAKTVRYRLERIHELGGIDLSRQQSRFDAQLAITILRVLSLEGEPR